VKTELQPNYAIEITGPFNVIGVRLRISVGLGLVLMRIAAKSDVLAHEVERRISDL